jgi:hypothetical protein
MIGDSASGVMEPRPAAWRQGEAEQEKLHGEQGEARVSRDITIL